MLFFFHALHFELNSAVVPSTLCQNAIFQFYLLFKKISSVVYSTLPLFILNSFMLHILNYSQGGKQLCGSFPPLSIVCRSLELSRVKLRHFFEMPLTAPNRYFSALFTFWRDSCDVATISILVFVFESRLALLFYL